jgi:hypothetical protein
MTMRERRVVQWSRVFGVYAVVAVICLAVGVIMGPPMHDVMLMVGTGRGLVEMSVDPGIWLPGFCNF